MALTLTSRERQILSDICEEWMDGMQDELPGPYVSVALKVIEWVELGE